MYHTNNFYFDISQEYMLLMLNYVQGLATDLFEDLEHILRLYCFVLYCYYN